jgi:hypothetical protein
MIFVVLFEIKLNNDKSFSVCNDSRSFDCL